MCIRYIAAFSDEKTLFLIPKKRLLNLREAED
jgi:hypothetical protein